MDDLVAVFEVKEDRLEAVVKDLAWQTVELLSDRVGDDIVCGRAVNKLLKDVLKVFAIHLAEKVERASVSLEPWRSERRGHVTHVGVTLDS